MKTLAALYCLYDHQFFTPYNLEHIYNDVDEIIIAYGPFEYYPEVKKFFMGYSDDNTLDIVKKFMRDNDPENKIKLIVQDMWPNYYSKRIEVQKHISSDWFFNIGPDEFFMDFHLSKVKDIINEFNDEINAVYHPRLEFFPDFHHFLGSSNLHLNEENRIEENKRGELLPFYNGEVWWDVNDTRVIMTVSGYKNEEGLYWQKNDIDAILCHYDGTPFADLIITYFDASIIRHHYFAVQEGIRHFLQRAVYYNKIREPERSIVDIAAEQEEKCQISKYECVDIWSEKIKEFSFAFNGDVNITHNITYNGEYPTVIKHHPCFGQVKKYIGV